MLLIEIFPSGPFDTNAYLIACEETKEAWIIDPAPESGEEILSRLEDKGLTAKAIILTHSHWDHLGDMKFLKDELKIPVYVHELDAPNVIRPGSDRLPLFFEIEGCQPNHLLKGGEKLKLGTCSFEVIHTPGHSPGGICLYEKDEGVLISGDTLFKGTIGNLSFPGCSEESMWTSLDKLAKLPPQTKVYPGHGPSTTIGQESWLPKAKELFS